MTERVRVLGSAGLSHRLTRRGMLTGLAAAGVGVVSGCGSGKVASSPPLDGEREDQLTMYSWGDYDDPAVLKAFRRKFDVLLQVDSFGSNEEMMAKLGASRGTSGYDIVVPTGLVIPQMVKHDQLQKLDKSLLPNLSTMDPNFLGQPFDPKNTYSVCKNWGTTGFVFDKTVHRGRYTSWKDFLDLAKGPASGKTSLLEDPWEVCSIALGISGYDLNTVDAQELSKCRDIVVNQLAPHVRAYLSNVSTPMGQGGFTLMQAFNGDARLGMQESDNPERWAFVFPSPSANLWTDNWCLATGAPHPDAAHDFINYIIAPDQAMAEVDYHGYPTGSKVFLDPKVASKFDLSELIFPTQKVLDRLTVSEFGSGQQARVDILTRAKVRSGA
ncbi:polyamine ABC transporter substrate-binding protein [Demetria terragena]|uniref:polyamine ABC transporter substrate-binding protein n=1 Tax=Demetria terragena TaxID=63959 RepID=UPI000360D936|nr:spermidine/putrescine ABC transporter substrate-binding protein [Demetria terragena]